MTQVATLAQLQAMSTEGGGGLRLHTFTADQYMELAYAAKAGDVQSNRLFTAAGILMDELAAEPPGSPRQNCDCCGKPLPGFASAVGVITADVAEPKQFVPFTVCTRCGETEEEIRAAAQGLVRSLWPAARTVIITHPSGGRA